MPLTLQMQFTTVYSIESLAPNHPVFLVTVDYNSRFVVKQENQGTAHRNNLQHNLTAMHTVDPNASAVALTDLEIGALRGYADQQKYLKDMGAEVSDWDDAFQYYANAHGMWLKMNLAGGMTDLGAAVETLNTGGNNRKSGVRHIANVLNAPDGLESLGRVMAADLYNQNSDRFAPIGGGSKNPRNGMNGASFNCLVNIGNVLVAQSGTIVKPIGLDSWDPTAAHDYADITRTIPVIENATKTRWWGRLLAENKIPDRVAYARNAVQDLEAALGPRNRRLPFKRSRRLDRRAVERLAAGLEEGRTMLIDKMQEMMGEPNPPAGLASRVTILTSNDYT